MRRADAGDFRQTRRRLTRSRPGDFQRRHRPRGVRRERARRPSSMVSVSVGSPADVFRREFVILPLRYSPRRGRRGKDDPGSCESRRPGQRAHAYADEVECSGDGWRIVPAASYDDWPVLEATPQRLRAAFQTARVSYGRTRVRSASAPVNDRRRFGHRLRAQRTPPGRGRGYSVNVSYVSYVS